MKVLARVLLGLGAFLLIAGILAVTYAPGVVKKTPLDVDTTTVYAGEAAKIDPAHRRLRHEARLRHHGAPRRTRQAPSDDHVIFVETRPAPSSTPAVPGSASTATTPT